jgi:hypothetical protein
VKPVFITGDHRSGTTFLYRLLDASGRFNIVTTYHVLRYRELLARHLAGTTADAKAELAGVFRAAGLLDRGIDGVPLTPDMPEEYGFILTAEGRGLRPPPRVTRKNLPQFTEICRKVQFTGDPARVLLLKNPWDFDNFLYLKGAFPDAKFLFLHRDPARVVNSQLRAARSMLAERNAYLEMLSTDYARLFHRRVGLLIARGLVSQRHGWGARLLARRAVRAVRYETRHRCELPDDDAFGVRYEDLCSAPNETVAAVISWLGLPVDDLPDFRPMVETRPGRLLPEVERLQPRLAARLEAYYTEYGYTIKS